MVAEAGGNIRAGIGSRLRAAREKKGLTLLQAAERMHVDSRILESLEAEDFAALGAPVYARGHLRHYAELVDESAPELQQLYADATRATPAQPDLTRIARMEPGNDSGKLVGPVVIGLVAVALVGTVWWVLTMSVDKVQPKAVRSKVESTTGGSNSAVDTVVTPEALATAASTGAASELPVALPVPTPEPSMQRGQKGGKGATPAPSPTPGAKAPAAAKGTPPSAATGTPAASPNATAPPPAPRGKEGQLTLKFSSDSWAEVYDASGQRLFYDVGAAASAHTVRGPAPLRVILGNASGVAVEYNGRPALIPPAVQPDGSARFVINAHGRTVPASPASDGE